MAKDVILQQCLPCAHAYVAQGNSLEIPKRPQG
jgi:hypothetical protein